MRTRVVCILGPAIFVWGCSTVSLPGSGIDASLSGNWTLRTARNIDSKAKCGCSICRKRDILGLPPLTENAMSVVINAKKISSAADEYGNPIAVPKHTLAVSGSDVILTLESDFYSLPAGDYVLSATVTGGYALNSDNDPTASDGRVVSVSMDRD